MRSGLFLIVLLGLIMMSSTSFATSQGNEDIEAGPDTVGQELENVDLENQRLQLEQDLRRAKIRLGFGVGLTSLGGTTFLSGIGIIIGVAIQDANTDYSSDDHGQGPTMGFLLGGAVAGIGLIPLFIGIPLWLGGHKRKTSAMEKLHNLPTLSIASGGVFQRRLLVLRWRF